MDKRLSGKIMSLLLVLETLSQVRHIWQYEGVQPEAYKNMCSHFIVLAPKPVRRRLNSEC